jgi:hypothetical protein
MTSGPGAGYGTPFEGQRGAALAGEVTGSRVIHSDQAINFDAQLGSAGSGGLIGEGPGIQERPQGMVRFLISDGVKLINQRKFLFSARGNAQKLLQLPPRQYENDGATAAATKHTRAHTCPANLQLGASQINTRTIH